MARSSRMNWNWLLTTAWTGPDERTPRLGPLATTGGPFHAGSTGLTQSPQPSHQFQILMCVLWGGSFRACRPDDSYRYRE